MPFLRCHWGVSAAAIFAPETPREKRSDSETEAIVSPMLTSSSRSRLVHKISAKWCREEGTAKCSCRFGGQPRFLENAASETVRPVLLLSLCFFLFFLFFCFFVFCFLFLFSIFLFFGSPPLASVRGTGRDAGHRRQDTDTDGPQPSSASYSCH